jgi:hypothetical protein
MTKYLISFPSEAMVVSAEELPSVAAAARAVIEEAKAAGVYVFGGGIAERPAFRKAHDDQIRQFEAADAERVRGADVWPRR